MGNSCGKHRRLVMTERQYKMCQQRLKGLIGEECSGIDPRMREIAEKIYNNFETALKDGKSLEPVSADFINSCQEYFKTNNDMVLKFMDDDDEAYAAFNYDDKTDTCEMSMNPSLFEYGREKGRAVNILMHELTHMVNTLSGGPRVLQYNQVEGGWHYEQEINNVLYLFTDTEMNSRLSQYYHLCLNAHGTQTPSPSEAESTLAYGFMANMVDKIQTNSYFAYQLFLANQKDKPLNMLFFTIPIRGRKRSYYEDMLMFYKRKLKTYKRKIDKIYYNFSSN